MNPAEMLKLYKDVEALSKLTASVALIQTHLEDMPLYVATPAPSQSLQFYLTTAQQGESI